MVSVSPVEVVYSKSNDASVVLLSLRVTVVW